MSATAEPMPRAHQYKLLKDIRTIDEAVDHPEVIKRFQNALGDRLDAVQYLATIRNLIREDELFRKADVWELIRCALDLAELGLRPNTPFNHAWIIPRVKNRGKPDEKVTLDPQLGYQGLLELAYRADTLESIHADVVYEGDLFEFEYGSNAHLKHVPKGKRRGRPPLQAYAYAKLKGGGETFVVWDYADILEIRDDTEAYKYALSVKGDARRGYAWDKCVWVKFEYQQACKTILKQVLKVIPKSSERLSHATYIDGLAEAGKISYGGSAGDMRIGPRELTHQPGATLHDFGFKTTIVDAKPEPATTSAKPAAQHATASAKPAETKPANGAQQASTGGWDLDPPDDRRFPDEPKQTRELRLISEDGEIMLDAMNLTDWAKEFVDHFQGLPAEAIQAFEEHNADIIQEVLADSGVRQILLDIGVDGTANPPAAGGAEPGLEGAINDEDLIIHKPSGRVSDQDIIDLWTRSLEQITTQERMAAWKRVNFDNLGNFHSRVKMPIYKVYGAQCRALGIEIN